jgi:superfamily I DNA/RNA helicase
MKKIRIQGSPGTGKTRRLVRLYYDNIQTSSATEIIMTSHTNTAADEIRDRIKDKDNILKYENETKKSIYHLIKESTETLKETVTTIHKYCCLKIKKIKGQSVVFNGEDYEILKQHFPLFNTHAGSKKLHTLDMLIANHPFFRFHSTARDNGLDTVQYYRTLSFEEKRDYKYNIDELQYLEQTYNNFKNNEKVNLRAPRILDFQDMIQIFTDSDEVKSEDLGIKILMVDEAQDSSVIQRAAEKKMAAAADLFYKAGDPDQSLFEFAGADPDEFHKEFANPEIELKQGYRCPRVINEYCKDIIRPLWKHYKYAGGGRVWSPRRELDKEGNPTGPIVEGEIFEMMSLEQDPNLAELTKRIKQTNESFVFTCRGNEPRETIRYLMKLGVPFKLVDKDSKFKFKYPTEGITNQRNFFKLTREDKKLTAAAIKRILKNILTEYAGENYLKGNLDKLEKGNFNIDWLIKHQFLNPIVKKSDDFQTISMTKGIEMKNFIRQVAKYDPSGDLERNPRIFVENIHTVKGEEFDNSVVDLTTRREEEDHTKRRIKYVACSRARKTLWIIKSRNGTTL